MLKSLLSKYIQLFRMEYLNVEKRLSDEKLMPKLRNIIHVLEKRNIEEKTNLIYYIRARKYYFEAKRRDLLSSREKDWCEKVLFGKTTKQKPTSQKHGKTSREFSEVLTNRRSVRTWQDSKLEKEIFKELIEAAKWAPSSCNRQPWHFIITRKKEKIELLYEIKRQKFLKEAPNCILVLINKKAWSSEQSYEYFSRLDAGAAIQNLLLKAEELRLGACWVNWNPESISEKDEKKVRETFDIPHNLEVFSIIPIGKTESSPLAPGRKDTLDMMHFENYKGD